MSAKRFSARKLLVLALGATAAVSLAAPAGALGAKVTGTLQFTPPSDFHGKVNSKTAACRNGARVNLWRFDNAADTTADKLGSDKASRNGAWEIMVPNAQAGEYQVQIRARHIGGHYNVDCKSFVGARLQF